MKHKAWKARCVLNRPGVHQFVLIPEPYFEPIEDSYIIHYTKTVVAAFGEEEGWSEPVGLPAEIVPLTRPFGNYAGNVFRGLVLVNGKPAPNADVEVEYYNARNAYAAPNPYFVTQVVKTDADGIFVYGVPWVGWWGFAALSQSAEKMDYKGEPKPVEIGAVLWTEFAAPLKARGK
jgi:cobalt/nickel transport protein